LYLNKNNIKSDRREEDQERLKTMERIWKKKKKTMQTYLYEQSKLNLLTA
jgi:hypothetical protein